MTPCPFISASFIATVCLVPLSGYSELFVESRKFFYSACTVYLAPPLWITPRHPHCNFTKIFVIDDQTRNSPGDEIANVNFFYDDSVHEFSEITQNKGHYAVQGHSRSPILVPIESTSTTSYNWLIVTYLLHVSYTVSEI